MMRRRVRTVAEVAAADIATAGIDWWGWLSEPAAARCGERALPGTNFPYTDLRQILHGPVRLVFF